MTPPTKTANANKTLQTLSPSTNQTFSSGSPAANFARTPGTDFSDVLRHARAHVHNRVSPQRPRHPLVVMMTTVRALARAWLATSEGACQRNNMGRMEKCRDFAGVHLVPASALFHGRAMICMEAQSNV